MSSSTIRRTVDGHADAYALLMADHELLRAALADFSRLCEVDAPGRERASVGMKICDLLLMHADIEDCVFYPAALAAGVDAALLQEAAAEHAVAKEMIGQVRALCADDDLYDAKVIVLGEYVDRHTREEEHELFPACRRANLETVALGLQLAERRAYWVAAQPAEEITA